MGRALRRAGFLWLLVSVLAAQMLLFVHESGHALEHRTGQCQLCLHAPVLKLGLVKGALLAPRLPSALAVEAPPLPHLAAPAPSAFRARAPPFQQS